MKVEIERARALRGEITPPPDKSISHRAVMLSSIARGRSVIRNFLRAADTLSTVGAFRALGVEIRENGEMTIEGKGLRGLAEPLTVIDCGNSGTTMRLLSGVLAGCPFFSVLSGDESLTTRPMARVVKPLRLMGANIAARQDGRFPPLAIQGGGLKGIRYEMPVASAQVKSALLLAGLYAEGETEVVESVKSRDHTERMLPAYGASLALEGNSIKVKGGVELTAQEFEVPNDMSSAAFFLAAAAIVRGSGLTVKSTGINPTRAGFLEVMKMMGASVKTENVRTVSGEPVADILCEHSSLKAVDVDAHMLPSLIDEFPVLCVLAALAEGTTTVKGAAELRVKESDRIRAMADGLRKMGVRVEEFEDGLSITGGESLRGAEVDSFGDHRIAMAFAVAGLVADGKTTIKNADAVRISFPGFFEELRRVQG